MENFISFAVMLAFALSVCCCRESDEAPDVDDALSESNEKKYLRRGTDEPMYAQRESHENSLTPLATDIRMDTSDIVDVAEKNTDKSLNIRTLRDTRLNTDKTDVKFDNMKDITDATSTAIVLPADNKRSVLNVTDIFGVNQQETVPEAKTSGFHTYYISEGVSNDLNVTNIVLPPLFPGVRQSTPAVQTTDSTISIVSTGTSNATYSLSSVKTLNSDLGNFSEDMAGAEGPTNSDKDPSFNEKEILSESTKHNTGISSGGDSVTQRFKTNEYMTTNESYNQNPELSLSGIPGASVESESDVLSVSVGDSQKVDNPVNPHFNVEPTFAAEQANNTTNIPESDPGRFEADDEYTTFRLTVPEPDWELAKRTWRYAWEIHVYILGTAFGIVGLYNVLSAVSLWRVQRLLPLGYFMSLHTMILVLCFTRCFYLLHDGYNSRRTYLVGLNQFLYSVPFTCLTSTFSLLAYSLLKATQVHILAPLLQKLQVLIPVIACHFLMTVIRDVLTEYNTGTQIMHSVCQMFFITWGSFLFFGYSYIFRKLYSQAVKRQDQVVDSAAYTSSAVKAKGGSKLTLSTAVKVTFLTATSGLIMVGLEIYALIDLHYIITADRPKPWPWWMYHTVLRLTEIFMSLTMSYSVSLPLKYQRPEDRLSCSALYAPCSEIMCCAQSINERTENSAHWSNFQQLYGVRTLYNDNTDSLTDNSTVQLLDIVRGDPPTTKGTQPSYRSRSSSLLVIDDVYVSFHTDHDINKIVDSLNDVSHGQDDIHKTDTFHLRGSYADKQQLVAPSTTAYNKCNSSQETDSTNRSRGDSLVSNEIFRVPSSVSLAESMENEIVKAFENLKRDTYVKDDSEDSLTV